MKSILAVCVLLLCGLFADANGYQQNRQRQRQFFPQRNFQRSYVPQINLFPQRNYYPQQQRQFFPQRQFAPNYCPPQQAPVYNYCPPVQQAPVYYYQQRQQQQYYQPQFADPCSVPQQQDPCLPGAGFFPGRRY